MRTQEQHQTKLIRQQHATVSVTDRVRGSKSSPQHTNTPPGKLSETVETHQ